MRNKVRVAVVQMKVTDNSYTNTKTILRYINALPRRTDIACFPETCINCNEKKTVDVRFYIERIAKECAKKKVHAIVGSYEKEKGKTYNIAYLISGKGKILYKYKKAHMWRKEALRVSAGKSNKTIKTSFGKIGIIVCWDYAFPEYVKMLSKQGAEIIFCPNFLVDYKGAEQFLRSLPIVRAFENMCYYVTCDAFTERTACMSFIASPHRILKSIEKKEGFIVADLDMKWLSRLKRFTGL